MKQCGMAPGCHNLNIKMYSFKELLALFKLSYTIDINELKRAKMMVLKMHPDKSRLPPDYFLFYKKAFDVIVDYYNETQKVSVEVPQNEIVYQTDTPDKSAARKINSTMKEMGAEKFQQTFNTLFEKNMVKTRDDSINDWFKSNEGDKKKVILNEKVVQKFIEYTSSRTEKSGRFVIAK